MKKIISQHLTLVILVGILCVSMLLWLVFKPTNTLILFDDTWIASHQATSFGEHCTVRVADIHDRSDKPGQESRDAVTLLKELSIDVISHIQQEERKSYRLIKSSSPLGATDDKGTKPLIILETIFDGNNEYARYDTAGSWIAFPYKSLADMNTFIQKMFQDQFYFSLDDIRKETVRLKEIRKETDGKELTIFRGEQTERSLENAKQLFQYPIGTYSVREHYGDVVVDPSQKTVLKTILYTLFEYHDRADSSIVLDIPVYQECVPVPKKDLEVFAPSNVIWASKEEIQQYLLFKVVPE